MKGLEKRRRIQVNVVSFSTDMFGIIGKGCLVMRDIGY